MKNNAKWIWYYGDFEIYHNMLLSCRRQEKGCDYPCMWYLSQPERSVLFYKEFEAKNDTVIHIKTYSKGMIRLNGELHPVNEDVPVKAGNYELVVELFDLNKFPSLYLKNEYVSSDETWTCNACDRHWQKVGYEPAFVNEDDDPSVFPFIYEKIFPVEKLTINDGVLYDFGKETFGPVTLCNLNNGDTIELIYGESKEEALDKENAIIHETLSGSFDAARPSRAFRYIFLRSSNKTVTLTAEYEYLPIEDIASFECNIPLIKSIWDISAYTFHLNSREFFLDGIKRDRWVWSGDAYQSFMINRYLYNDNEITKRTIIALLGKPPYRRHINFINDYSCYLIMAIKEYLFNSGDIEFIKRIYDKIKSLYEFIISGLDENGFLIGREGDWVFIDWGVLDKDGPICAEQILLWQTHLSMAFIAEKLSEIFEIYSYKAERLYENTIKYFWCEEKGAFIDSFTSGKGFTSRQTNVFAVLFDFADSEKAALIEKNVFDNIELPQITTPYFKLYELMAFCKCGKIEKAQDYIEEYWGGMIELGATTVWEAFDPTKKGIEHYEMYGNKFGKSLCHAWGSGPILLLGRFIAGVEQTSYKGDSFIVRPNPGKYNYFKSIVPVNNGKVSIEYNKGIINILSDRNGGKLLFNNKEYTIEKDNELIIRSDNM